MVSKVFWFFALRPNPIMTLRYNLLPGRLRCLRSRVGASGAGVTIEDFDSRPGWCSTVPVLGLCCSVGISAGHQNVTKKYNFNIILYDASTYNHSPPKYQLIEDLSAQSPITILLVVPDVRVGNYYFY